MLRNFWMGPTIRNNIIVWNIKFHKFNPKNYYQFQRECLLVNIIVVYNYYILIW